MRLLHFAAARSSVTDHVDRAIGGTVDLPHLPCQGAVATGSVALWTPDLGAGSCHGSGDLASRKVGVKPSPGVLDVELGHAGQLLLGGSWTMTTTVLDGDDGSARSAALPRLKAAAITFRMATTLVSWRAGTDLRTRRWTRRWAFAGAESVAGSSCDQRVCAAMVARMCLCPGVGFDDGTTAPDRRARRGASPGSLTSAGMVSQQRPVPGRMV